MNRLAPAGITLTGSTGGGTTRPGAEIPPPDRHYVWVTTTSADAAIDAVRGALGEGAPYADFSATLGEDELPDE
jgi:hypothetical protein